MEIEINVKLFASLRQYSPPQSRDGSFMLKGKAGMRVNQILELLSLPPELSKIVLINGCHAGLTDEIRHNDTVSIFPPLAGGMYGAGGLYCDGEIHGC